MELMDFYNFFMFQLDVNIFVMMCTYQLQRAPKEYSTIDKNNNLDSFCTFTLHVQQP